MLGVVSSPLKGGEIGLMMGDLAVTPDEAATSLIEWTEKLDISKTGQYWAPRGPSEFLLFPALPNEHSDQLNRRHWYSRCDNRDGSAYTTAVTLVIPHIKQ